MKKYIVIGLLPLLCYSCSIVTKRGETPAPEVPESVPPPAPVAEAMPTTVKKKISDQDLKKENADQELKKRVVVLPILDRKGIHDLNVLKNVRSAFVDSLNATGELIALDPAVLKLSLDSFVKNNAYDMEAIGKAVAMVGASSLLEIKIVDMRFQDEETTAADNTSSQRSRNVAFDVVVQARMHNIRSGQELFNTVKTVSVEEENSKIKDHTTKTLQTGRLFLLEKRVTSNQIRYY